MGGLLTAVTRPGPSPERPGWDHCRHIGIGMTMDVRTAAQAKVALSVVVDDPQHLLEISKHVALACSASE